VSPVFFCDRNLGKRFALELRKLGLSVELHDDHFAPNAPDEDLLRFVASRGWVVLTLDKRMRYRQEEKAAILHYGAGVILLSFPKNPQKDWLLVLASEFYQAQSKVEAFLQRTPPPFLARFRVDPSKSGRKHYRMEAIPLV
jgi:hypothetical protein